MKKLSLVLAVVAVASGCGGSTQMPPVDAGFDAGTDAGTDAGVDAGIDAGIDAGTDGGMTGPLTLAPGDVAELTVSSGVAGASLATPNGDEKFLLVLASTQIDTSGTTTAYSLSLATPNGDEKFLLVLASTQIDTSGTTTAYSLSLGAAPSTTSWQTVSSCSLSNEPWRTTPLPNETVPTGTPAAVGDTRTINVLTGLGHSAITAQVVAVGNSAVVWADITATHPANLDAGFVTAFLSDYETKILPRERTVFGMESDQDGDGHIALVFTPLTYQTAVAFFTACDLESATDCPSGNRGEYLYLTPPATIAPPYNTPNAIKEILTHETSHLIHYNHKVLKNGLSSWDDSSYLIEGVGGFAQDAVGPQAGNLYVAKAGLDGIDAFSLGDTLTDGAQYDPNRDGVLRGGSYWFVRYVYDRGGGDTANVDGSISNQGGTALLRALLDAPQTVATAIPLLTPASIPDLATDFYTTLAMSNRDAAGGVAPTNPCFAYLPAITDPIWNRQRGANTFATFSMMMTGPATQAAAAADGQLRNGGVEYLVLDAAGGAPTLDLTLTVDPAALPRVRVGRLH